jgi:hypothetical protein
VKDQSGAAIVSAEVRAVNLAAGDQHNVVTNQAGKFAILVLQPGMYRLVVRASGFQQKTLEAVPVSLTETTTIDVSLQVGAVQDSVTVSANPPLVQTAGPQLGRVVDEAGISNLPLATRNFTQILSLSPGTATYLPDSTGVGKNTQAISVNGARVTQNNYQINGIDVNTLGTNGPILVPVPAPETIQEFKVQTSLYDATYGRAGGANIQILTKSGTNAWHGSAYEYLRNNALNANDSFLKSAGVQRPVLRRSVFGGTFGGPVRRNRAFFFVSYQGARETNGASLINSISSNVLIAQGLTDDRSQATLLATFHPTANGQPVAAINPAALALLNAKLPNGRFLIPTPGASGRFTASSLSFFQEDQFNANFDYGIGPKDSLSAKVFFANSPQTLALPSFRGTGPNVPGFGSGAIFNNRVISLQQVRSFSSTLVNEARLGYSFNRNNTFSQEPITDTQAGIARSDAAQYPGLPLIRIAQPAGGVILGTGSQVLARAAPSTTTLNDTISIVHGQHSLRTGAEIRYSLINFTISNFAFGQIDFSDFNSFLVGNARTTTIGSGLPARAWRAFDYNFFAQDDWKFSSRLTINLGVRYELDLPIYDSRGRLATFDPALYQPRMQVNPLGVPVGPPVGGLIQAGDVIEQLSLTSIPKGGGSLLKSISPYNFAPRLGFAASPRKSVVLRGGYGLFYSRPTFQYSSLASTLPPYYVIGIQTNAPFAKPFLSVPASTQFPTFVPGVALAGTAFDRNLQVPYLHQFNLTTQFEFLKNWLLEVGYVGSRGRRLFRQVAINQALLATAQAPITNAVTGAVITTNTPDNAQLRAPFQGVSVNGFFMNQSDGESSYDSLQASLARRFMNQLELLASYTFARSIDDASGAGGGAGVSGIANPGAVGDTSNVLGNQLSRRANRGVSDFNRTHRLVVSYVWDLPTPSFARRSTAVRYLISNWNASGILTAMSGLPVDIVDTGSGSLYGLANGSSPLVRPSFAPGATCATAKQNIPTGYSFNPFAFRSPVVLAGQPIPSSAGTATAATTGSDIGNVPRNCLTGPSQSSFDFAATKIFHLGESRTLEFRTEFFNAFNRANLANPISNLNAVSSSGGSIDQNTGRILQPGNFGRIIDTSANPRIIQFALRVLF